MALAIGTLRLIAAASAPSASSHGRPRIDAGLLQEHAQRHAGPLAARDEAVNLPARERRRRRPVHRPALLPEHSRKCMRDTIGYAQQRVDGEDQRALHHAVDQQAVRGRIDVGDAAVVPLEVKPARRDHAVQRLQGCARGPTAGRAGLRADERSRDRALVLPGGCRTRSCRRPGLASTRRDVGRLRGCRRADRHRCARPPATRAALRLRKRRRSRGSVMGSSSAGLTPGRGLAP